MYAINDVLSICFYETCNIGGVGLISKPMNTQTTIGHFTPISKQRVEQLLVNFSMNLKSAYPVNSNFECVHMQIEMACGISRTRTFTIDQLCTISQLIDIVMASSFDSFKIAGAEGRNDEQACKNGFAIRFCNNGTWVTADVPGVK